MITNITTITGRVNTVWDRDVIEVIVYESLNNESWSQGNIHHFWRDNHGDIQKLLALDTLHTEFMALQIIGQSFDDILAWVSGVSNP
jgi:hypothetical protein